MKRRHLLPVALVAAALPVGAASAQEPAPAAEPDQKCKLRFDKRALSPDVSAVESGRIVFAGEANDSLRVKTSRRDRVTVTRSGNEVTFDVLDVTGETFAVERLRTKKGKAKLRLVATFTTTEGESETLRINVQVKALERVCRTKTRGRGPETEAAREQRVEAGRGRGAETEAEREARTTGASS